MTDQVIIVRTIFVLQTGVISIKGFRDGIRTPAELAKRWRRDFPRAYKGAVMVLPTTQFVNFRYIPSAQRILYMNGVAIVWNSILSALLHSPPPKPNANKP
jgi:Mpv17 / PMP22 family